MKILILLGFCLGAITAQAAGLNTPFSLNTTQVLPKGIRSLNVSGINTTVDTWYDDTGVGAGVAQPFNQKLSYGRLLKAENDKELKLNVEAQLRNLGVPLDNLAGSSFADINSRVMATIPSLAYGVTERLTVAVAVPIVYTNLDVETGFVGSDELQSLVTEFASKSKRQTQLIQQKLQDVIATELANKGYKPLVDSEQTQLGDLVLVAKYLVAKGLSYSWAITNIINVPTAHFRDTNKLVDPTPGDGQWDYGITSTVELPVTSQFRFLNNTGYTFQFADVREARVPISNEERASADIDFGANRDLGDQMFTSWGMIYDPVDWFSVGGTYTVAYKQRDQWTGVNFTQDRYDVLGIETEQWLEALYLQASFSTIGMFRRKVVSVPFVTSLGYGQIFDGRNVRKDPIWSLNATMFF